MTFGEEGKEGKLHNCLSFRSGLNAKEFAINRSAGLQPEGRGSYPGRIPGSWAHRGKVDIQVKLVNCKCGSFQIDTARTYTGGTSEEYLGKIDWRGRGLKIETKLYPNIVSILQIQTCHVLKMAHIVESEAAEPKQIHDLAFAGGAPV